MRTVFLALLTLVWSSISALAAPLDNTYTHHTALAVPERSASDSFKLAKTWFLPDWQAGWGNRAENTAPDKSGDRHDLTCSTYDGCLGIPDNMTCTDNFTIDGKTCYKSCSCKSGYNRVSSSDVCAGCANPCLNLEDKSPCPYGCQKSYGTCSSKCETCYPDNCRNRTPDPDKGFGCEKYFDDCSTKCEKAYADNCHKHPDKPLASTCANGCALDKTLADCSSKCSTGCKASCDPGYYLSADELSCSYDLCQKYADKPLVSSCANGCALGQTANGCSSRCATGCKAKCSSPKTLTSDQLTCQCPAKYNCDGSDRTKICYDDTYWGDCDGKTESYINLKDPLKTGLSSSAGDIEFYYGNKNGYDSVSFTFSIYGKSYSYALYLKQFTEEEKNTPIQIVNNCQQLITALENQKIVNIQISGHIVCSTKGININGKKYVFGQNRNNDKIELNSPLGTIDLPLKKDTIIKFSDLSLFFSKSWGNMLPRAPVVLENVILQGENNDIFSDGVYLFNGNNEIQIMNDSTNSSQCRNTLMGGGAIIMIPPNAHVTVKRYNTSGALISSPVCKTSVFRYLVLGTMNYDNFSAADYVYSIYSGGNTIQTSNTSAMKVIRGYYMKGGVDLLTDNSQLQINDLLSSSLNRFIMGNKSVLASSGPQDELINQRNLISTGTGALIKYPGFTVSFPTGFSPYILSRKYSCNRDGSCN